MPRVLLFAPCEKVIIDENTKTTSLIVLFEAINLAIPQAELEKVPKDATLPISWHIVALWQAQPGDMDRKLEQRFTGSLLEGAEVGIEATMDIDFQPDKPNFRSVLNILGMPLYPLLKADFLLLKLFFREKGDQNEWQFAADFPMIIKHS